MNNIELDSFLDLREKENDAANLIGFQETDLLRIHNAVIEHHVAKTAETQAYTAAQLDLAADLNGECAASLNRSTQKILTDLRGCLNDLISETADGEGPDGSIETMRAVRDMLIKGCHKLTGKAGDDMSFIDAAIDMLNEQLPDFGGQAFQEANNAE